MKKFVIKTINGETLYVHAQHFVVDEHDMINFIIYNSGFNAPTLVASCVKKNVVCIYIEDETTDISNQEVSGDGN